MADYEGGGGERVGGCSFLQGLDAAPPLRDIIFRHLFSAGQP